METGPVERGIGPGMKEVSEALTSNTRESPCFSSFSIHSLKWMDCFPGPAPPDRAAGQQRRGRTREGILCSGSFSRFCCYPREGIFLNPLFFEKEIVDFHPRFRNELKEMRAEYEEQRLPLKAHAV